ncbi:MAG: PEPxxWA-CTERM sorting domain-containing protein [Phenylobacterium sp.]
MKAFTLLGIAAPAAALLISAPAMASELVKNGNFDGGNVGFSTNYTFGEPPETDGPGNYFITDDAHKVCGCFAAGPDHTGDPGGLMMVLDGAGDANSVMWSETVNVVPESIYTVSFWVRSLGDGIPKPLVQGFIDGLPWFYTNPINLSQGWIHETSPFKSDDTGKLTLTLIDITDNHLFNDLAIDDISIQGQAVAGVPEPASWALMIAGFGLAGAAIRRRRGLSLA